MNAPERLRDEYREACRLEHDAWHDARRAGGAVVLVGAGPITVEVLDTQRRLAFTQGRARGLSDALAILAGEHLEQ